MDNLFLQQELKAVINQQILLVEEMECVEEGIKNIGESVERLNQLSAKVGKLEKQLEGYRAIDDKENKVLKQQIDQLEQGFKKNMAIQEAKINTVIIDKHKHIEKCIDELNSNLKVIKETSEHQYTSLMEEYKALKVFIEKGNVDTSVELQELQKNLLNKAEVGEYNLVQVIKTFRQIWWKRFCVGWGIIIILFIFIFIML